eukprot:363593-Chlamydomonas_euryale.AAC.2
MPFPRACATGAELDAACRPSDDSRPRDETGWAPAPLPLPPLPPAASPKPASKPAEVAPERAGLPLRSPLSPDETAGERSVRTGESPGPPVLPAPLDALVTLGCERAGASAAALPLVPPRSVYTLSDSTESGTPAAAPLPPSPPLPPRPLPPPPVPPVPPLLVPRPPRLLPSPPPVPPTFSSEL